MIDLPYFLERVIVVRAHQKIIVFVMCQPQVRAEKGEFISRISHEFPFAIWNWLG
jgi:hypothetical protein